MATRVTALLCLVLSAAAAQAGPQPPAGEIAARVSQAQLEAHVAELTTLERWTPAGQQAARDYISQELASYGYAPSVDAAGNVRAELVGTTDANSLLVVGGHYDSVPGSPGADDDASGTSGMLEVARVLSQTEPQASALFVAWADEEIGLVGSQALAFELAGAGTQVVGAVSLEMIGFTAKDQFPFGDIAGCFLVSTQGVAVGDFIAAVGNTSAQVLAFAAAGASHVPELRLEWAQVLDGDGYCIPDTRRSDHAPFWDQGWPALLITDTANFRNQNYHEPTDTAATLDFPFATRVTAATAAYVAEEIRATAAPEPSAALLTALGAAVLLATRRGRGAGSWGQRAGPLP